MARIPQEQLIPHRNHLKAVSPDQLYGSVGPMTQTHQALAAQVRGGTGEGLSEDPAVAYASGPRAAGVALLRCLKAPNAAPLGKLLGIDVAALERELQAQKWGWEGFTAFTRVEWGAEQCQGMVNACGFMGTLVVNQDLRRVLAQGPHSPEVQRALKGYETLQEKGTPTQDLEAAAKDRARRVTTQTDEEVAEIEAQREALEAMGKVRAGQPINLETLGTVAELYERLQKKPRKKTARPAAAAPTPTIDRRDRGRQTH